MESLTQFESRKQDHLRLALEPQVQAGGHGLNQIELVHEALPEIDFSEVNVSTVFNEHRLSMPIFISSMTAGHEEGEKFNRALAKVSSKKQILMGVGSQRRELTDAKARDEWKRIREEAPQALFMGNLGLAQVIQTPTEVIEQLVESLQAIGLFIHLNPLQEALQPEGTPQFRGGLEKIREICSSLKVPVVIKEVGCGFSLSTLKKLEGCGLYAVDVSGRGGTHWGRIEGLRAPENSVQSLAAQTFSNWGTSTLDCMLNASEANVSYQIWASGGVRNGLDAAKLVSLGAQMVGLALPWLVAFKQDPEMGVERMAERLEFELKTALFCTGCRNMEEFGRKRVWKWRQRG